MSKKKTEKIECCALSYQRAQQFYRRPLRNHFADKVRCRVTLRHKMAPSSWHCSKCKSPVLQERPDSAILAHCKCCGISNGGHSIVFAVESSQKPLKRTLFPESSKSCVYSQIQIMMVTLFGFLLSLYFVYEMSMTVLSNMFNLI
uniref:OrfB_Zn_ribbon domain-containing protein n=1 Tax=Steinernema glaseri TaxID=37863 RepID=A0A1I7Z7S5_9BILA